MTFNRDGSPAQPLGWQPGIDWEVTGKGPYEAIAYDEDIPVAVIRARSKLWLHIRISRAHRRLSR
jgi:hypothetical protein